jgi:hypothetical protein
MAVMITYSMKVRRQLRSARVTALTIEERRSEMREAEARMSGAAVLPDRSDVPTAPAAAPKPPGQEPTAL